MAANSFDVALAFTWRPEFDGQPLHVTPGDRGGATAWGVTLAAYADWRQRHGFRATTVADLRAATKPQLSQLIRCDFWDAVRGDDLPPGVNLMTFDFGFTAGSGTSVKVLQGVLDVAQDGQLGQVTLRVAASARPADLVKQLQAAQLAHYRKLSDYNRFGRGWTARTNARAAAAMVMLSTPAPANGNAMEGSDAA